MIYFLYIVTFMTIHSLLLAEADNEIWTSNEPIPVVSSEVPAIATEAGDATWYDISAGFTACGTMHSNNDFVAAIASSWWAIGNPNKDPMCKKTVRVTNPSNGKTITIEIQDKCAGCQRGDIDLTPAAFQALGVDLGVGRFKVTWIFLN